VVKWPLNKSVLPTQAGTLATATANSSVIATKQPCAVERDALSGRGSRLSPGASAYQRTISNNSYAHDEQGVNPGQVRGFDGVHYKP